MYGVHKSQHQKKNKTALSEFLSPLDIMPFDEEVTDHYGRIRAWIAVKRLIIGSLDMMIAAHVQCLSSTLITNNIKEFRCVPDLNIEDWT